MGGPRPIGAPPDRPAAGTALELSPAVPLATATVGFLVGIAVGLTSMGGGALLTPALVLLLGVPIATSVGSNVFAVAVMKLVGGATYSLRREVHWPTVGRLALGSMPAAALGVLILNRLPAGALDAVLRPGLGASLVLAGAVSIFRLLHGGVFQPRSMPSLPRTVALGAATGFLVATTSVGSGSLLICVLSIFFPLKTRTLVGTDLVHALLLTATASAGHLLSGRVDLSLSAGLLLGGIPGVVLGARISPVVPERLLRSGIALLLVVVGLLFVSGPATAAGRLTLAESAR